VRFSLDGVGLKTLCGVGLVSMFVAACGGEGGEGGDGQGAAGGADAGPRLPLGGAGAAGGSGPVGGGGAGGDTGGGGGVGGMGGAAPGGGGDGGTAGSGGTGGSGGEAPPPGPVEDCAAACERYATCDRLDRVGGDVDACLDRCEAVEDADRATWYACVGRSACGALGGCIVPRPPAPGCDALCARLDACGAALPGCAAACEDAEVGPALAACGASLGAGCDADALDSFWGCAADAAVPACGERCDAQAPCVGGGESACLRACLTEVATGDALTRLRLDGEVACYAATPAGNCDAVVACAEQGGRAPLPGQADFCAAWSNCGWEFEYPCDEIWFQLDAPGGEPYIACFWDTLSVCGDIYTAFDVCSNPPPVADNRCALFCGGLEVCDLESGSWPGRACEANCRAAAADVNAAARLDAVLACTGEATCAALGDCLESASPEAACAAYCASRAACDPSTPDACAAECLAQFGRRAVVDMRACVAAAGERCEDVLSCRPPALPDCELYCRRYVDCGYFDDGTCVANCEEVAVVDAEYAIPIIDCVIAAPTCEDWASSGPTVALCGSEPWRGLECSALCRQGAACEAGAPGGEPACLVACGAGPDPTSALRLDQGRACLNALLDLYPTCEQIDGCLPPLAEVDCVALCADASRCGVDFAECETACAEDALGGLVSTRATLCLAGSEACADVERCLSRASSPVVSPTLDMFCTAWNRCGYEDAYGPCDWGYADLGGAGAPGVACLYSAMQAACADVWVQIDACNRAPVVDTRCTFYCEAAAACGHADAPNACLDDCRAFRAPDDAARFEPIAGCGAERACPAFNACLEARSPAGQCAAFCAARAACEAIDAAACETECEADFARIRATAWRDCVADAGPACDAIEACRPPEPPPCARACARLETCGLERDAEACIARCEDTAVSEFVEVTLAVGCVLSAPACDGPDGVATCWLRPDEAAPACQAWCRLVDDCDPDAVRDLGACALACATGFEPEEALRFASARDCLTAAGGDATCRALRACLPGPAVPDCEASCGAVDACGIDLPSCAADCAAEPVALAGCVAEALRLRGGCGAVATCVGYEAPPAPPACRTLCAEIAACDPARDAFLCERTCAAEPAAAPVQAACLAAAGCRGLEACVALDEALAPVCAAPCDDGVACGAFPDAAACNATCTGYLRSRAVPADYVPRVTDCLAALGAPDVCVAADALACFEPGGGDCGTYCDAQIGCGWYFPEDRDFCLDDCAFSFENDPDYTARSIDCAEQFLAGFCDIEGFFTCADGI
jgi:hypothetical protein